MSEKNIINKTGSSPITTNSLIKNLKNLGLKKNEVLITHSSLSSLGWVSGGAVAVINALISVLGNDGTLVMPSHSSDISEPSLWENPPVPENWWQEIRDSMPVYNPKITPSRGMGIIAEIFRSYPEVKRSNHPHLSFCAFGRKALEITNNHPLTYGLGEESPLGRLYELDAKVLLIGVEHTSNTSLHLSEIRAYKGKEVEIKTGAPLLINNKRQWTEFKDFKYEESDFSIIGDDFKKTSTSTKTASIGMTNASLISMREIVDFGENWIQKNRKIQ